MFIFLISQWAIADGSYSLTELKYAQAKWTHPKQRVLPVVVGLVDWAKIPIYLKSVAILKPQGNVAAEVLLAVESMQPMSPVDKPKFNDRSKLLVEAIGLLGILGSALFANWDKVFPSPVETQQPMLQVHEKQSYPANRSRSPSDLTNKSTPK